MKVLIVCVGSRGDAEPFCALAAKLLEEGNEVEMFVQPELQEFVPKGVHRIHLFPFTQMDFYKYVGNPSHGQDHENPRVRFVGVLTDTIGELVLPCAESILSVAAANSNMVDCIVTSSLSRSVAFLASSKFKIPTFLVHLQPLVPTRCVPHYSNSKACVEALLSKELKSDNEKEETFKGHLELETVQHEFLKERLDKVYAQFEETPITLEQVQERLLGQHESTILCNAYSDVLIPSPNDYGPMVKDVGALADSYIPKDFEPPSDATSDLLQFLEERPICIGFGSMPYDQVQRILEALETLNQKAILVGDALKLDGIDSEWVTQNVRQVSGLPYAWLLPRCKLMMSHGGAGVTHATLRAGIPAVICPYFGDQFFFADYLQALGLGVRATSNLTSATTDEMVKALKAAEACIPKAKDFQKKLAENPSGVDRMYQVMQETVNGKQ